MVLSFLNHIRPDIFVQRRNIETVEEPEMTLMGEMTSFPEKNVGAG